MNRKIVYITAVVAVAAAALSYLLPGPAVGYESKGKRDPFIPLIGQEKVSRVRGLEEITSVEDIFLEGIAIGPVGNNIAILNGQMVKENNKFGALQIKKISKKTVEISIDGKFHTLSLQEEEGIKVGE